MCGHFGVPVSSSYEKGLVAAAQATERQAGAGNDLADAFFDAFAALRQTDHYAGMNAVRLVEGEDFLMDAEHIYIRRLTSEVLQKMAQVQYPFARDKGLSDALKQHPRFVVANEHHRGNQRDGVWKDGGSRRCWWFKRESDPEAH
jgi:hypothetical protein